MKTSLQIAKKGDPEHRKAKDPARANKKKKKKKKKSKQGNGSELCKLLRRQPLKKRAGWKLAQVKSVKQTHSEERKEPYIRESKHTK